MTTTFDTSGAVGIVTAAPQGGSYSQTVRWANLSPFTQGYIEALLQPSEAMHYSLMDRFAGFSDLAPETLARIIADCEARSNALLPESRTHKAGAAFWGLRQEGRQGALLPPLTVHLGDDGKVRFA